MHTRVASCSVCVPVCSRVDIAMPLTRSLAHVRTHAVYSIVDESTFTELEEIYQCVRFKDPDGPCPPMVLCGSKSDLYERRVISWERGEQRARDWGCSFIEVSAMTGARVTVAFRQLYAQVHLAQPRRPGKPLCVLS